MAFSESAVLHESAAGIAHRRELDTRIGYRNRIHESPCERGLMQAHEKWKTISNTHVSVMSVFVTTDLEWKVAGSVYFVQIRDTRSGKRSKLRAVFVGTSVACGIKF